MNALAMQMPKHVCLTTAGKSEVVRCLLQSGANPRTVNNMGKTASNMAAFVGEWVHERGWDDA